MPYKKEEITITVKLKVQSEGGWNLHEKIALQAALFVAMVENLQKEIPEDIPMGSTICELKVEGMGMHEFTFSEGKMVMVEDKAGHAFLTMTKGEAMFLYRRGLVHAQPDDRFGLVGDTTLEQILNAFK